MCERETPYCPECRQMPALWPATNEETAPSARGTTTGGPDRRQFIRMMGGTAATLALIGGAGGSAFAAEPAATKATKAAAKPKPAEDLIRELFTTLTDEQKGNLVLPWNHGEGDNRIPTRRGMYNSPLRNQRIADHYTAGQQELVQRILKSICNGEEGYQRISRDGTWDNSKTFDGCGAHIFGDPTDGDKFAWLFTGHHLTVRCDGNSEPGAAFGGPLYYGHLKRGWAKSNVFHYQTMSAQKVYEALDGKQREKATLDGSPGEHAKSIQLPGDKAKPGIAYADLSADQRKVVEQLMRDVLSPFRAADGDEVMQIIKATGGMEKIHLAFYNEGSGDPDEPWHFWRLEGPGFVWNFRILPHVHCYVNIADRTA